MNRVLEPLTPANALCAAVFLFLYGCGGGGAAPPSAPLPPAGTGGTPPSGTPTTPAQPPTPTPPAAPPAPSAPMSATITTPERTFSPSAVTVAAGGTVTWQVVDDDHEVIFVGSAPPGGNLGEIEEGSSASRTFTATGTYSFECLRHRDKGMRGTIVVQSNASGSPPPTAPPPAPPPPSTPPAGSAATVTTPNSTFSPADVTITTGGTVTWQFSGTRHNVVFQGTTPAGGNIPDQDPGASVSRTFAAPGTYNYFCARHSGMTGRVTVQ
jgi:plastocyanin